jgi:DNA (cytosine-5)-methyltransferase 1
MTIKIVDLFAGIGGIRLGFEQACKELGKKVNGMPLTLDEIYTFFKDISKKDLQNLLNKLVAQGYIVFEHPKNLFEKEINGKIKKLRIRDETKPKGYNIVTGKLSFPISKILDPNGTAPTIVATDVEKLAVPDGKYIRRLTNLELLRLFGYPDDFKINNIPKRKFLDLMGNTVVVPVIKEISLLILKSSPYI